jgi:hypothetical protein
VCSVRFVRIAVVLSAIIFACPTGYGQLAEREPNQPCSAAQDLAGDSGSLPLEIDGEITPDDPATSRLDGDVDFFFFAAPGGAPLRARIVDSTSTWWPDFDPVIGLFDEACNYVSDTTWAPDGSDGPQFDFFAPPSGRFTLGVSAGNDAGLWGNHFQAGLYTLQLAELQEFGTVIRGRVIDAATGYPLGPAWFLSELYASQSPLRVWVSLYRCETGGCEDTANVPALQVQRASPLDGTFAFLIDDGGTGIPDPSFYLLKVDALDYQLSAAGPFEVHPGQISDVGDIELAPPPLVFNSFVACDGPLGNRGRCQYSVEVTNTTASDVRVRVWSLVEGRVEPGYEFTRFPAIPIFRVAELGPYSSETLRFSFYAPGQVPAQFKSMCADVRAADDSSGFFNLLRHSYLFCMVADGATFGIAPIEASYAGQSGGVK